MKPEPTDRMLQRLMALHPRVIDLSLGRIERLLAALGHPERDLPPVIHVAGTNGKGSVVAMLAAMADAAGLSAHVYISPHLVRFHERIRPAGKEISESALARALGDCESANDGAPITFFEITTAAAFLAFSRTPADLTILETGLGGRLDATNVVARPAVTVITPVSMDHQGFLGNRLADIAGEKAGILKPGVPAVIGPQRPAARSVIERRATDIGAPLIRWGAEFHARATTGMPGGGFTYRGSGGALRMPPPALPGHHQIANAATAMAAARALAGVRIGDDALCRGMAEARWPARLQFLAEGSLVTSLRARGFAVWLDGGHNPAAGRALARFFAAGEGPLYLMIGMLRVKDTRGFLRPFRELADGLWTVPVGGDHEGRPPDEVAADGRSLGLESTACASIEDGLARIADRPPGRVLITGSLYLAGEVLARLQQGTATA